MAKPAVRGEIVRKACRDFTSHSSRSLAKLLVEKHSRIFPTYQIAYNAVRHYRGARGPASRRSQKIHNTPTKRVVAPLPESQAQDRLPFVLDGVKRVAVLSDIHIPFHDLKTLKIALKYIDKFNPDCILLNGDVLDFEAISHWPSAPGRPDTFMELQLGREFLWHLRQRYPKSRIVFKEGNHDQRYEKYLMEYAPKLFNIDAAKFSWHVALGVNGIGVEMVGDQRIVQVGKLSVLHGHEVRLAGVHPARSLFTKLLITAMAGHCHRETTHSEQTADGRLIATWSTGCLCHRSPDFAPYNKWSSGFALVEVQASGDFTVALKKVIDGKVY